MQHSGLTSTEGQGCVHWLGTALPLHWSLDARKRDDRCGGRRRRLIARLLADEARDTLSLVVSGE